MPAGAQVAAPAAAGGLPPIECVRTVRDARIAREAGDAAGARQKLEAAVELPGCELPALSDLLRLLQEVPEAGERAATLRERLAGRLGDPTVELPGGLLTQLVGLGRTGDDPAGDALLLEAVQRRSVSAAAAGRDLRPAERIEMLDVTALLQERLGQEEAARETLARLLAIAPSDALRWRALLFDLEHERWESAAELLAPLAADPEAPEVVRFYQVEVLAHLGRYDEMLRALERLTPGPDAPAAPALAASAPPGFREIEGPHAAYVALSIEAAWALRDAGRDAEAAGLFRRALALDPEHREAQAALLHLYGTEEERTAAAAATQARRQSETSPEKLFEEGTDLLGAGDAAGAIELLARAAPALAGSGYAEPAWYNLGNAAVKLERWEQAAHAFEQAIAVNPTRTDSHFKRGVALFHLGRCAESVPALQRTLELQADKRDAHFYLSGCYARLGNAAAAAREKALFEAR